LIRRQLGNNIGDFFNFHGTQYSIGGAWFSDGKGFDRHPPVPVSSAWSVSANLYPPARATPDILRLSSQLRCVCGLLGAIHTSHELMVKTPNQGITTMHVRSGHDGKRWYLRSMIDYLVD
jgi:hypothetical protein